MKRLYLISLAMVLALAACVTTPATDVATVPMPPGPAVEGMVHLSGGTYMMGCSPGDAECSGDERPAHLVTLKSFWIAVTETTNEQYAKCAQTGACTMAHLANVEQWAGATQPVVGVTWNQAAAYCRWAGRRLPTEAEWEYAARAGSTASRYGVFDAIAWSFSNADQGTHPVGARQPNAWGLYDMLGNAWEWTADYYAADYYRSSPTNDPPGPPSGSLRVVRGGGWETRSPYIRVSARYFTKPDGWGNGHGFRCVRD